MRRSGMESKDKENRGRKFVLFTGHDSGCARRYGANLRLEQWPQTHSERARTEAHGILVAVG